MVIEKIFQPYWIERRPLYSLYLGLIFSVFGFITALLLFRDVLGLASIFFTVMLALPSINSLLRYEEYLEVKDKEGFFKEHENIFDVFLYFFIGVFLVFFILGLINTSWVYNAGIVIAPPAEHIKLGAGQNLPAPPQLDSMGGLAKKPFLNLNMHKVYSIIINNLYVMLVAFALSLFYGAGSLFLVIFNASVWASVTSQVVLMKSEAVGLFSQTVFATCNLSVMFIHAIPEMAAYLLAAIGGGVLSKALWKEGIKSPNFWKVFKDAFILMGIAVLVTIASGFIEVGISEKLFTNNVCGTSQFWFIIVGGVLIAVIILLELLRWRHKKKGNALGSSNLSNEGVYNSESSSR